MIDTFSSFYYGHTVDENNQNIPFRETGGGDLNAVISIGTYTLTEYLVAVASAMNAVAPTATIGTSVDRSTRLVTITSDVNLDLLISSGSTVDTGAYGLLGFTGSDQSAALSFTGTLASGESYRPQLQLQSYVGPDDFQRSIEAAVNKSTSGDIETVRFGVEKFIEFDIKFITDMPMDGKVIKTNPNGVSDARAFLQEITQKRRFEFNPDRANPDVFSKVILEATPASQNGTGYKLRELFAQGLRDIYETGLIRLRVLT